MGEIADALRRADRLDPPPKGKQGHSQESGDAPSHSSLPPTPASDMPASESVFQPAVGAEQKDVEPPLQRLLGDRAESPRPSRICLDDPQGHIAQQYRRLALRLRDLAGSRNARSIVITSAQAGDGKTTTACNLAVALANIDHNRRVVLVDLDLHRASIASSLGIQIDTAVGAVLRGESTLEQATIKTDVDGLFIVAATDPSKKPEQLLAHHTLAAMIATLESRFDWVIIDTPPILATSDTQVILQHAATALLVVQEGVSPVRALHKAIGHLPTNKILASFLNSSRTQSEQHVYYDDYYRDLDDLDAASSSDTEETDELNVERN